MNRFTYIPTLLIALALSFAACSEDDPITPDEEHLEAEGVALMLGDSVVATIFQGETNDTLRIPLGALTPHLKVVFLDSAKVPIAPDDDGGHTLGWAVDGLAAEVYQHAGEEGSTDLHLRGLAAGTTSVEFFIVHAGHNDFRSGKIPAIIENRDIGNPHYLEYRNDRKNLRYGIITQNTHAGDFEMPEDTTTHLMRVAFFTESGEEFYPNAHASASLEIQSLDENVVRVLGLTTEEPYLFRLQSVDQGLTSIVFRFRRNNSVVTTFDSVNVRVVE